MTAFAIDYSAVSSLMQCPRKWALESMHKVERPVNSDLYLGAAVHMVAAGFYDAKLAGAVLEEPDFLDLFVSVFDSGEPSRSREGDLRDVEWRDNRDNVRALGIELCRAYYPFAKLIEPILVEHKLERGTGELLVYGTIDLITSAGTPVDIKTSSRALYQTDLDASLQPTFYCYLLGGPSEFHYHDLIKGKICTLQRFVTKRTKQDLSWLEQALPEYARMMQGGVFPPNRTNLCKWCSYRSDCLGGRLGA